MLTTKASFGRCTTECLLLRSKISLCSVYGWGGEGGTTNVGGVAGSGGRTATGWRETRAAVKEVPVMGSAE